MRLVPCASAQNFLFSPMFQSNPDKNTEPFLPLKTEKKYSLARIERCLVSTCWGFKDKREEERDHLRTTALFVVIFRCCMNNVSARFKLRHLFVSCL
jgi:hypothetical protein